jgi:hypothetical protein
MRMSETITVIVGLVRKMPRAAEPLAAVLRRYFFDNVGLNPSRICGSSSTHRIPWRFGIEVLSGRGALFTINSFTAQFQVAVSHVRMMERSCPDRMYRRHVLRLHAIGAGIRRRPLGEIPHTDSGIA